MDDLPPHLSSKVASVHQQAKAGNSPNFYVLMQTFCQNGEYAVVAGLLFDTQCMRSHIVPVSAMRSRRQSFKLKDFNTAVWLPVCTVCEGRFVSHFPSDSVDCLQHPYTILFSCSCGEDTQEPNLCIGALFRSEPPPIRGNVLVFKHWSSRSLASADPSQDIIGFERRDIRLAEEIVKWCRIRRA